MHLNKRMLLFFFFLQHQIFADSSSDWVISKPQIFFCKKKCSSVCAVGYFYIKARFAVVFELPSVLVQAIPPIHIHFEF